MKSLLHYVVSDQQPLGDPPSKTKTRLLAAALSDPKSVVLMFAAYLYLSGFVFAYYYYAYFGLPFSASDVPVYQMFVYAFNVFYWPSPISLTTVALLAAIITYGWFEKPPHWLDTLLLLLFAGFTWMVFNGSATEAEHAARDARIGTTALVTVELVLKDDAQRAYARLPGWSPAIANNGMRLLTQNKEYYYLIYQASSSDLPVLPDLRVYSIRKDDVLSIQNTVRKPINS